MLSNLTFYSMQSIPIIFQYVLCAQHFAIICHWFSSIIQFNTHNEGYTTGLDCSCFNGPLHHLEHFYFTFYIFCASFVSRSSAAV